MEKGSYTMDGELSPRPVDPSAPALKRFRWIFQYLCLALAAGFIRLLPLSAAMRLVGGLGAALGPYTRWARKVRMNLRVVFRDRSPQEYRQLERSTFRHFGVALVELIHLRRIWRERDKRIEFVVHSGADTPTPERPAVYTTAHVGPWELAPLVGPHHGFLMPIIYAPLKNPYINRMLTKMRYTSGNPLVSRDGGTRGLLKQLNKGHSIGLTMDTRLKSGEKVPFFGEQTPTNSIPARLAMRYGYDLVPLQAERLPKGRFRVTVHPPIRPVDENATTEQQIRDMTRQANELFEQWIIENPGNWLCMKRRWPKDVHKHYDALAGEA